MCDDKMGSCGPQQGGCGCGHHGCGGFGHRSLLRVVLALLVLGMVFSAGVKVGEMKALYGYGEGGFHRGGYPLMMEGNAGYGMMQTYTTTAVSSTR